MNIATVTRRYPHTFEQINTAYGAILIYAVGVMEYLLQRRSISPAALFRPEIKLFLLQTAILLAPDTGTTNKMTHNVTKSQYISCIHGLVG